MFKQIIIAALAAVTFSASAADSWTGVDKIAHAGVSAAMAGVGTVVAGKALDLTRRDARIVGAGACFAVGVAKELYDMQHPDIHTASVKDLAADAIGCAVGAYIGGLVIAPHRDGVSVAYRMEF